MAVAARAFFPSASQAEHDRLDASINARLEVAGGPPDGLMTMVTYPQDGGFVVIQVFRDEETLTRFVQDVCLPAIAELQLEVGDLDVAPVWSYARP